MKKITTVLLASAILLGFMGSTLAKDKAKDKAPKLTLSKALVMKYQCGESKDKVKATYYTLSDDSLSFVKLKYKDKDYTLPRIISASGVRYSVMQDLEWWEHKGQVSLNEDVTNEESPVITCTEVAKKAEKKK